MWILQEGQEIGETGKDQRVNGEKEEIVLLVGRIESLVIGKGWSNWLGLKFLVRIEVVWIKQAKLESLFHSVED